MSFLITLTVIDMYAVIPSKKIYSYSSEKVLDNKIDSVSIATTIITKTDTEPKEYTLSSYNTTLSQTVYSDYRDFGTEREGDKGKARDKVTANFAKSTISFSADKLVDFSKLDLLFGFSTVVKNEGLSHKAIENYSTYAVNSQPNEKLPFLPPPNSPQSELIVDPTDRYIDSLFKKNVYFTMSNLTSTSATITVYFVQSVILERELIYEDSGTKATKRVTVTSKNKTATVSTSYKQTEQVTETYEDGKKSFSYPSSDLLRKIYFADRELNEILAYTILEDYAEGKEVAKIVCEIGEYDFRYKTDNEKEPLKVISQSYGKQSFLIPASQVSVYQKNDDSKYNVISVNLDYEFPVDVSVEVPINGKTFDDSRTFVVTIKANSKVGELETTLTGDWVVDSLYYVTASYKYKQVFEVGDSICPMVRSAIGTDKPLSAYSDKTPKIFFVAATRIYYDGAVWQELTLKEENRIV